MALERSVDPFAWRWSWTRLASCGRPTLAIRVRALARPSAMVGPTFCPEKRAAAMPGGGRVARQPPRRRLRTEPNGTEWNLTEAWPGPLDESPIGVRCNPRRPHRHHLISLEARPSASRLSHEATFGVPAPPFACEPAGYNHYMNLLAKSCRKQSQEKRKAM